MKKYITLSLITAILLTVSIFIPSWIADSRVEVTVTTEKAEAYTESVIANGNIEYDQKKEVYSEFPVIPDQVLVQVGDHVQVGDVLATVNVEDTCAAAVNLLNLGGSGIPSDIVSVLSGYDTPISKIVDYIPDQIIATANGTVTELTMVRGAIAMPTSALAVISESNTLQARIAINEASVSKVKSGQKVTVSGTGFKGRNYTGVITKVYPTARKQYVGTTQETVVDAIVAFDHPDDAIKSGFSVKAVIETAPQKQFYTLPYECIEQDNRGEYVYVYQFGKAWKKYVQTGIEKADSVEIKSGISPNDIVIVNVANVKHNTFVKITEK